MKLLVLMITTLTLASCSQMTYRQAMKQSVKDCTLELIERDVHAEVAREQCQLIYNRRSRK